MSVSATPASTGENPAPTRPGDLILVMTDQQRWDQWERYDDTFVTPTLLRLAEAGAVYEEAVSGATTCVPARMSLLTGRLSARVPRQDDHGSIPEGTWTIAQALQDAGYQTALIGKMHFNPIDAEHGFEIHRSCENRTLLGLASSGGVADDYHQWLVGQGRQEWNGTRPTAAALAAERGVQGFNAPYPFPAEFHPTEWITREALGVLAERDPGRPLFLVVSYLHPHAPLNPPEPWASRFSPDTSRLPTVVPNPNKDLPDGIRERFDAPSVHWLSPDLEGEQELRVHLSRVRAMVNQIDESLDALLGAIDLDTTTVAFTSDHGDYAGHRGLLGKSPWLPFDDICRVPLIIAGPAFAGRGVIRTPVQSFDLVPTFLTLAGVDVPDGLDSIDLSTSDLDPLRPVLTVTVGMASIREGRFKLIRLLQGEVLFDLEADPDETINQIRPEHYDLTERLDLVLYERLADSLNPPPFVEVARRLKEEAGRT